MDIDKMVVDSGPGPSEPAPTQPTETPAATQEAVEENVNSATLPSIPPVVSPPPAPVPAQPVQLEEPPAEAAEIPTMAERPLDVTDALSYLDAVKMQFQDQPAVYNRFLDIMKDFKSQIIDTPGVIKRVSLLFNGHPSLIQGFNTFLPVGYRIECSTDADDANYITVTTPTGSMMQALNLGNSEMKWDDIPAPGTITAAKFHRPPSQTIEAGPIEPSIHPPLAPAVQYVAKIKQRCDPDTYQQFLAILSKWNNSPSLINEAEVSKQISILFKDEPDLRRDFRIFLPEDRAQSPLDDMPSPLLGPRTRTSTPSGSGSKRKAEKEAALLPPKRKQRKIVEKEIAVSSKSSSGSSKIKKVKSANHDMPAASYSNVRTSITTSPRRSAQAASVQMRPQVPDEAHFFDRVKRALDNRETYNEFLKVVNLFTQDYIDTAKLVKECHGFLGDGDLMRQFRDILGWTEEKERASWFKEHSGWVRPTIGGVLDRPSRADLTVEYGSYRRLPASEINVQCSARDAGCRQVLNDEWVSHPAASSEDTGFFGPKKNIYEEALHRSEEERHEYDFHIEAITRTIVMLEPINQKIAQLAPEERLVFKLKPNLGGSGKSIHQRVVKKIYGREAGTEVIQAMQETPALAIPVVLQRLKQKEEEWKRAQREWNKVWREVDAKNYHKSLDHQGISFKSADKRAITTKTFVSQIEAAREEQMANRASLIDPLFARTRPRHQLEFVIGDVKVLQDTLKLCFSFLDRTQIGFSERRRIENFLRSFAPLFFMLDPVDFNSAFVVVQETLDSDASEDLNGDSESIINASSTSKGKGRKNGGGGVGNGGDLRKKLLKSEQAKSASRKTRAQETATTTPSGSRMASPAPVESMDVDSEALKTENTSSSAQSRRSARKNSFFTNTIFYALVRLLEILYSRLALFKKTSAEVAAEALNRRPNPITTSLGLDVHGALDGSNGKPISPELYYELFLESCERLFDNEVEQHVFEDQMRYMFGVQHAYKTFTIDKVIGSLIKQVQIIIADGRSQDLYEILKRERGLPFPTTQDQINCLKNAEKIMGPDENIFRMDWFPESKTITMQLIGKDDSSFDDSEVTTGRWQAYVDAYVSHEDTETVPVAKVRRPFLRRNVMSGPNGEKPDVVGRDGLEIKVCVRTYRLFFVNGTQDSLFRPTSRKEREEALERLEAQNKLREKWIDEFEVAGTTTTTTSSNAVEVVN